MNKLKHCPFCGGNARMHGSGDLWWVSCWECKADMTTSKTRKQATTAWNRRTNNWIDGTPPKLGDTDQLIVIEYPAPISKAPLYAALRWQDGNYSDTRYQIATRWMLLPKGAE